MQYQSKSNSSCSAEWLLILSVDTDTGCSKALHEYPLRHSNSRSAHNIRVMIRLVPNKWINKSNTS